MWELDHKEGWSPKNWCFSFFFSGFYHTLTWISYGFTCIPHPNSPSQIDAFELCCWRRLPRVPWTISRSNLSIVKEINPEYSLEGLVLLVGYKLIQPLWSMDMSLKSRTNNTTWCNPTTGQISWESYNWKRHMYPNVNWSIISKSQDIEAT